METVHLVICDGDYRAFVNAVYLELLFSWSSTVACVSCYSHKDGRPKSFRNLFTVCGVGRELFLNPILIMGNSAFFEI